MRASPVFHAQLIGAVVDKANSRHRHNRQRAADCQRMKDDFGTALVSKWLGKRCGSYVGEADCQHNAALALTGTSNSVGTGGKRIGPGGEEARRVLKMRKMPPASEASG